MKELILLCLFCALPNASVTTGAASERDTVFDNAILTARGPETGRGVVSVSATWWLELPMADLRWVYVTDPFQTELQLRTVGILNFGELHARFRLVEGAHFPSRFARASTGCSESSTKETSWTWPAAAVRRPA